MTRERVAEAGADGVSSPTAATIEGSPFGGRFDGTSPLGPRPAAGEADEGMPSGLRLEAFADAEEAGRVAEVAGARDVLPGEPVDALQVEAVSVADQVLVGKAHLPQLEPHPLLEADQVGVVLGSPAHLGHVQ